MLLRKGTRISDEELTALPGDKVVLKVVSPSVVHKSDVLGVRVVPNRAEKIRSAWRRMLYEVPEAYVARIEKGGWHYPARVPGSAGRGASIGTGQGHIRRAHGPVHAAGFRGFRQ